MTDLEDMGGLMISGAIAAIVKQIVDSGAQPQAGFRLASYLVVRETFGDDFCLEHLGVPLRTLQRWRKELADLDIDSMPDTPPDEFMFAVMQSVMKGFGK